MSNQSNKLWNGRFSLPTNEFVETFTASVKFDNRMYKQDIRASLAHAKMLMKIGVLTVNELSEIESGMNIILNEIESGEFIWSIEHEDIHMNIEFRLTQLIGDTGKKLHTGRSRNDQVATDVKLYMKDEISEIEQLLFSLKSNLVKLAEEHSETIMPGYTHLQIAQPIILGHHILAWYEMLSRDYGRLIDCKRRLNTCPLGSAALAGTTYPIDRMLTAKELGFDSPCRNSLDGVSDRDFVIEFMSWASILFVHLSRISEELIIWSTSEFNFIELSDSFCTGSSIMPQKKNPDVPELIRGKTGRVFGSLISMLTIMKGQPLAYNKDNQEDKEPLFDIIDTTKGSLKLFSELFAFYYDNDKIKRHHIKFNTDKMYKSAIDGFSTATDYADYLVRNGYSFREAHEIVGNTVSYCIKNELRLDKLPLEQFRQYAPDINSDIYDFLTVEGSVNSRNHFGATSPHQVKLSVAVAKKELEL
jgi:argininosuccinate lyase